MLREEGPRAVAERAPRHVADQSIERFLRLYVPWKYGTDPRAVRRVLEEKPSERPVFLDLLSELDDGDVFFDVGARSGIYSGLAATTIDDGTVVSFEPNERTLAEYRTEMAELDLRSENETLNIALSDTDGSIDFYPESNAIGVDQADSGAEPLTVTQRRGDELVADGTIPVPDVLKIDVDGAEIRVLEGLRETLSETSCLLYMEVHTPIANWEHDIENHGGSISELSELLEELGFDVRILHARWNNYFIKARN